jgi:uncharacterized protein YecT (DUF1311 family)
MKFILIAASVLLLVGVTARAQDAKIDCKSAHLSMVDMDQCAGRDFQVIDAKLNTLYHSMMSKYSDASNQAVFKKSEESWLAYRDAECGYETNGSEGTINAMLYTKCRSAKTTARIKELNAQLHCEEGDLSCNVPH